MQITVIQQDCENTEILKHTSDSTPTILVDIASADPGMNDHIGEAEDATEHVWRPRTKAVSDEIDTDIYTSNDIIIAIQAIGSQMSNITKVRGNLQTQNTQLTAVSLELWSKVQQASPTSTNLWNVHASREPKFSLPATLPRQPLPKYRTST